MARIRRIYKTKEVGHSGTLDPLASGLMVLMIGEATKFSSYITEGDKSYQVDVRLGVETDTLDITGNIISEKPVKVTFAEVIATATALAGDFNLPIPLYSAKKIDGKKLYEYARENEEVQIPSKNMKFWSVENRSEDSEKGRRLSFHLHCSKGSFIRSWVKLLGERLDCGATMSGLLRTTSHHYDYKNSITLEDLDKMAQENPTQLSSLLIPMDQALPNTRKIKVKGFDANLLKNGQISHDLKQHLIVSYKGPNDDLVQIIGENQKILALVGLEPEKGFRIKRVFN